MSAMSNMSKEEAEAKIRDFVDTFGPEEDLHPDLVPYRYEDDTLGTCIKHPLIFSLLHHDRLNHRINEGYRQKLAMLAEFREQRNWGGIIFACYERAYRLHGLGTIEQELDDREYWSLLGDIWIDSENIHEVEKEWMLRLSGDHGRDTSLRYHMMDSDDHAALTKMRDPEDNEQRFTIHRGFSRPDREQGLSWSLDREKAEWFARRLLTEPFEAQLAVGQVKATDVIAYFGGRGESEIVAFPKDIEMLEIVVL